MRYDANHKERTRDRILAEAAAAIRTKGPDRVGVAEVMAKLDLTHGGFYGHFDSKDDLVAQAITYMFDQAYARFLRKTESREPHDGLANYIDTYLTPTHRDARGQGCALAALSGDLPRLPEAARARFADGAERLSSAIAKLLAQIGAPQPETLAWSVVAELSGTLALSRALGGTEHSDRLLSTGRESLKARLGVSRAQ
jgi:TetR/AcrR family transcriptional repressor of nem operon